ncbi:MAG: hypothetical protein LAQ30_26800 [Acidobacteriia bacterium]|nr:hypothetical protein [Terriglobia bacterium]
MPRVLHLPLFIAFSAWPALLCAETPPALGVGVFVDFDSAPGSASIQIMKDEVEKLLRPSGISLDWRLTKQNRGTETFPRLVVLQFRGRCRADLLSQPPEDSATLGEARTLASTRVAAGRVLPYGEVECDEVRQALSYLDPGAGAIARQTALGLALGRVVAHELYHILARTTAHAAHGLAKPTESFEDLISPRETPFQERDSRAIRQGFRKQ